MAYATGQLLGPILAGTLRVQLGARVGWDDVAFWEHQCLFFFFFFLQCLWEPGAGHHHTAADESDEDGSE